MSPCQLACQLANRVRCVLDRADMPHFSAPPIVGHRDRDRGLVHVEADECANFLHDHTSWLAGPAPGHAQGAALRRRKAMSSGRRRPMVLSPSPRTARLYARGDRLAASAADMATGDGRLTR